MANIREQSAPGDLGLNPSDRGTDSRAATARRIGAFSNQVAESLTGLGSKTAQLGSTRAAMWNSLGSDIATSIRAVSDVRDEVLKSEAHQEISHGAATKEELRLDLTQRWTDIAKHSDPNDPSVAAKFREEVAEPAFEKFQAGFATENGQKFAEHSVESMRQEFFEKTAADQSTRAGIAVRKNINDSTTAMSNTAMLDPSSVPSLLKGVDHSIAEVVGSSPTLSATDAARATGELSDATKKAIVHAGAIGAIQKSGNPEATADEWIKKYPDVISGADAKALAGNARQQIRARNYDYETNRRREKEITQDKSNEAANQYIIDVRSRDPKIAGDPTGHKILNDPTLTKADKNNLLNLIDRQLKPETATNLSQQTFVGLLREMRAPDADPDKVMQKAWDARMVDPGKPGSMSEKDFNQFRAEIIARKTPEGAALEHDRGAFFKNYATAITGNRAYDPTVGDPKMYNAEMDARRVENDLRKKGLDPHLAYDPSSEYFLGKPDRTKKWAQSLQQDLQTRATFGERFGKLPPAQQQAPKELPPPIKGDVKDGWQFLGGSPGEAANWKQLPGDRT